MFLVNKIKGINRSKDRKTLIANFSYLSLLQIASYIFPLFTMPYLARVIGVDGFGKIAFASAVIVWFQTVADWGFNFTATRDVAQSREDKEKVSEIFSRVLWGRCFLMLISFVLLLLLIWIIPQFRANANVILITFLVIPGSILFPDWFFQAMERMKYITILNLLSKLLFTIAVFLFIKEEDDYILQPLFVSLGFMLSGCVAFYFILVRWKIKLRLSSCRQVLFTINKSTDLFINNLMPNLYNSFSVLLLGFWGGSCANGILDAGNKFINIATSFLNVLSRTFFPFFARREDKHVFFAKLSIGGASFLALMLFCFAPLLIDMFFTFEFQEAVVVLRILSISIVFLGVSIAYGTNFLIVRGYYSVMRKITVCASIVGFLMAFPLIRYWHFIGAALVITITRGILGIGAWVYVKRYCLAKAAKLD